MNLIQVFQHLHTRYGSQGWWPADSAFEVMIGAILTQNTAWSNVEKAIDALKANHALSSESILQTSSETLAQWIRPSGYFKIKAQRLRDFCVWYQQQGGKQRLDKLDTDTLRYALLSVKGIGPETADDMLLYAFERPVFVIDAYTRRLFSRLQMIKAEEGYETLRHWFEAGLSAQKNKVSLFNEYHALIVIHAKQYCRKKPDCEKCPLSRECAYRTIIKLQ